MASAADVRRGIRYALATGPNPLAGWLEYQGPPEGFPGDSGGVAERSWAVTVTSTNVITGDRTPRTREGGYCESQVQVHWCRLLRMAGTTYDIDDALETEQMLLAWIHQYFPECQVILNRPGHPDHGKVCGGQVLLELGFDRAEFALQVGNNQVSYFLRGTLRYQWSHTYDWPHQPSPT